MRRTIGVVAGSAMALASLAACGHAESTKSAMAQPPKTTDVSQRSGPISVPVSQPNKVSPPTTIISQQLSLAGATAKLDVPKCELEISLRSDSIGFARNSYAINSSGKTLLDDVANAIPDARSVAIDGYTSSEGPYTYNVRLSQRRADAVRNVLALLLPGVGLHAAGHGPENPVAPNTTEEGRSQNRRVVITAQLPRDCATRTVGVVS